MHSSARYQLSALGIVNALGKNKDEILNNLLSGNAPGMSPSVAGNVDSLTNHPCWTGKVIADLPEIPAHLKNYACRNNQLLLQALSEIKIDIEKAIARYGNNRIGVVIGSSTSGILEGEIALKERLLNDRWPQSYHYRQQEIGSPALFVARYLQLTGVALTVSTACSSSAKAFATARNLLAMDVCDVVICGGADSLCRLTINGFAALESISPQRCEPFASGRNGITIGEGAALFLLTKDVVDDSASGRFIFLAGIGESSDAHHISAPHPEGIGAEAAMRIALTDADLQCNTVDYVNLHGTATPLNDAMESKAVSRVFGMTVECSSTKPLTGHTLGAAGATEAGLCWLLLSENNSKFVLPPQVNQLTTDTALPAIALLRKPSAIPKKSTYRMLSNSFAFGGSNAAVVLESSINKNRQKDPAYWLPHRSPMLLLDEITRCHSDEVCAIVKINSSSPFFDNTLQGVPAWVGLEYMAQTIGVWAGHQCQLEHETIKPLFLISSRIYECKKPFFRSGDTLYIAVKPIYSDENGVGAFDCTITLQSNNNENAIATAQVNTFRPKNPNDYVRKQP